MNNISEAGKLRIRKDMVEYSKGDEDITTDVIGGVIYVYACELSILRIFAKYNSNGAHHNKKVRIGYSENLNTWYASIEM